MTKPIAIIAALLLVGCQSAPPSPVEPAPVAATPQPTPSPTPTPTATPAPPTEAPWQPPQGWTQMRSEEGKELAYIRRDVISCRDGGDYCFEFEMMAREGCPTGLYIEGQLIDPNTNAVIGMGNDLLPRLLPGQVGLVSVNTRGPANISWIAKCY
jgi:hypothetical protein